MSDLPEPWSTWATRVGVRPSMTGIGEAAGLPASTISRLLKGRTTPPTISAVAKALRVSEREIVGAATRAAGLGPWLPPVEAHLLDDREREALNVIIRSIVEGREGGSSASTGEPEKKTPPGEPGTRGSVTEGRFGQEGDDMPDLADLAADHQGGPSAYEQIVAEQDRAGEDEGDR